MIKKLLIANVLKLGSTPTFDATPQLGSGKRICSGGDLSPLCVGEMSGAARLSHSQPEPRLEQSNPLADPPIMEIPFCFSQPAHLEDLLLSSQLNSTQTCSTLVNLTYFFNIYKNCSFINLGLMHRN